jgi:SAM-dependent methyltransferase
VTGFSADWLSLREPADARARDIDLTDQLARRAPSRFIDLACGTGANLRYLAARVPGRQRWLLVDDDNALLEKVNAVGVAEVETRRLDLSNELHTLDFAPDVVVTGSALLDLVSDEWLVQLVKQCRASQCAALFVLSYDGRIELTPSDADDEWIRRLVNCHQIGDKGFGPALGPAAWQRACELFHQAGYQVHAARSDWNLLPAESQLQQELLEGWAGAAIELASGQADRCRDWLARRLEHVANETSQIRVGHQDLLALPPG